jgi:hypothetical protein
LDAICITGFEWWRASVTCLTEPVIGQQGASQLGSLGLQHDGTCEIANSNLLVRGWLSPGHVFRTRDERRTSIATSSSRRMEEEGLAHQHFDRTRAEGLLDEVGRFRGSPVKLSGYAVMRITGTSMDCRISWTAFNLGCHQ